MATNTYRLVTFIHVKSFTPAPSQSITYINHLSTQQLYPDPSTFSYAYNLLVPICTKMMHFMPQTTIFIQTMLTSYSYLTLIFLDRIKIRLLWKLDKSIMKTITSQQCSLNMLFLSMNCEVISKVQVSGIHF